MPKSLKDCRSELLMTSASTGTFRPEPVHTEPRVRYRIQPGVLTEEALPLVQARHRLGEEPGRPGRHLRETSPDEGCPPTRRWGRTGSVGGRTMPPRIDVATRATTSTAQHAWHRCQHCGRAVGSAALWQLEPNRPLTSTIASTPTLNENQTHVGVQHVDRGGLPQVATDTDDQQDAHHVEHEHQGRAGRVPGELRRARATQHDRKRAGDEQEAEQAVRTRTRRTRPAPGSRPLRAGW